MNPSHLSQRAKKVLAEAESHAIPQEAVRIPLSSLPRSNTTKPKPTPKPEKPLAGVPSHVQKSVAAKPAPITITKPKPAPASKSSAIVISIAPPARSSQRSSSDLQFESRPPAFDIITAPNPKQSIPSAARKHPNECVLEQSQERPCIICFAPLLKGEKVIRLECQQSCFMHHDALRDCAVRWLAANDPFPCPERHLRAKRPAPEKKPLQAPTAEEIELIRSVTPSASQSTLSRSSSSSSLSLVALASTDSTQSAKKHSHS